MSGRNRNIYAEIVKELRSIKPRLRLLERSMEPNEDYTRACERERERDPEIERQTREGIAGEREREGEREAQRERERERKKERDNR